MYNLAEYLAKELVLMTSDATKFKPDRRRAGRNGFGIVPRQTLGMQGNSMYEGNPKRVAPLATMDFLS